MSIVLHTTPPLGPLPASDPESIRLLAVLVLAGLTPKLATADWSANGQPFITHLDHSFKPSHITSIPGCRDPDTLLNQEQRADNMIWSAYVEGQLTDLVNHTMYSLPPNYPLLARAQLACTSFPQTHYVPQRLRGIVKARLEHVGLWGVGGFHDGNDDRQKSLDETFVTGPAGTTVPRAWSGWRSGREAADRQKKFGEEAIVKRARAVLDPLVRRLRQGKSYIQGERPCTLDAIVFAHITLLILPPWPNPLLADLIRSAYPELVEHHDRFRLALFPHGWGERVPPAPRPSWRELAQAVVVNWLPSWSSNKEKATPSASATSASDLNSLERERSFVRGRWAWFAGAGLAFATYVLATGIVSLEFGGSADPDRELHEAEEDEDEDDDDDDEVVYVVSGLPVWEDGEGPEDE